MSDTGIVQVACMRTKSEELFEKFVADNNLAFERIKEDTTPRPDYLVSLGDAKIIFELKELAEDENFDAVKDPDHPHVKSHSRTVGDHVSAQNRKLEETDSVRAKQGIPSVLLIYNNVDPVFQAFGTEDMDFVAAMYGEFTIMIEKNTRQSSEMFHGNNQLLQERKNTSFSSVGRLCDRDRRHHRDLVRKRVFKSRKLPYDRLPPCFEVRRVEVSHRSVIVCLVPSGDIFGCDGRFAARYSYSFRSVRYFRKPLTLDRRSDFVHFQFAPEVFTRFLYIATSTKHCAISQRVTGRSTLDVDVALRHPSFRAAIGHFV